MHKYVNEIGIEMTMREIIHHALYITNELKNKIEVYDSFEVVYSNATRTCPSVDHDCEGLLHIQNGRFDRQGARIDESVQFLFACRYDIKFAASIMEVRDYAKEHNISFDIIQSDTPRAHTHNRKTCFMAIYILDRNDVVPIGYEKDVEEELDSSDYIEECLTYGIDCDINGYSHGERDD